MSKRTVIASLALFPVILAAGIWTGLGGAGQSATTTGLTAKLSAAQEVPKPKGVRAGAQGAFTAALSGRTLTWRLTYKGLTGRAAAAHIHAGPKGKAGAVRVALCGPCTSGARGSAKVDARTVTALLGGGTYVNVHTGRNAAGEIRGQVAKTAKPPVIAPPPTTTTSTGGTTTEDPYPSG